MLKTNKPLYKFVIIVSLLCIVCCLVAAALSIFDESANGAFTLDGLFIILAMLAAAYYMLGGYAKNAAKYYKVFTVFASLSALVTLIQYGVNGASVILVITAAIVFSITLYMAFSINQGKKRSLCFCGIALALRVVDIVVYFLTYDAVTNVNTFRFVSYLILAFLLGLLTFAKYVDKDARGTI